MPNTTKNLTVVNNGSPVIGDHDDLYHRLIQQLPNWFGSEHDILDTVLEGYINTGLFVYSLIQYVSLQMRLQTATEDNLDLISKDYLGDSLPRRTNENDDSYRNRISANLLQEKATRPGMSQALYNLTGFYPVLFEPWYPWDCGGYNVFQKMGYSTAGKYGSGAYTYQGFIDVFVSAYQGMASYSGYNDDAFGYNAAGGNARGWYGGKSLINVIVSDQDIYDLINLVKPEGTISWVKIHHNVV